jgi:putative transposase
MLQYHLILVTKYRKRVINDTISVRLREIFDYIASNYNISVEEWNHDEDHVHILFRAHPNSELSKFINAYKSASSRLIKKENPSLRKHLWKEMFWSRSFCLITTGGVSADVIRRYIQTQGRNSEKK